jgi:hypothetical protein
VPEAGRSWKKEGSIGAGSNSDTGATPAANQATGFKETDKASRSCKRSYRGSHRGSNWSHNDLGRFSTVVDVVSILDVVAAHIIGILVVIGGSRPALLLLLPLQAIRRTSAEP